MAAGTGENRALLYILYHRKKGMSFEESDHYWKTTHAKTALSIPIFTKNLTKYEQVCPLSPSPFPSGNSSTQSTARNPP